MRLLLVSLLLSLGLAAEDRSPLARAVARFGDDRPDVRRAAAADADRYVREALAPLLGALKSPDPEVRRRAREMLRALVPFKKKEEEPAEEAFGGQVIVVQNGGQIRFRGGRGRRWVAVAGVPQKDIEALKAFGLEGHAVMDETLRRQLRLAEGRGFLVRQVIGDGAAKLGLRVHDIILRVHGDPVMRISEVLAALGEKERWHRARMRVLRDGEIVDLPTR